MWTTALPAAALLAIAAGVCYDYEKDYYAELGCEPQTVGEDGCATSYNCSSLIGRDKNKCYYKGGVYNAGDMLESSNACLVNCRCGQPYSGDRMAITCVSVECSSSFYGPPAPGCYQTYEEGHCCSTEVCENKSDHNAYKPVCKYNDKEYRIGQAFWPEEAPCLECTCQLGNDGSSAEPLCHKLPCNLELSYGNWIAGGCIPVYHGNSRCCPTNWLCPENVDTTALSMQENTQHSDSGPTCSFAGVTFQVGETFTPTSGVPSNTECMCRVPPHPICIERPRSP